jgi:hypothetical protein
MSADNEVVQDHATFVVVVKIIVSPKSSERICRHYMMTDSANESRDGEANWGKYTVAEGLPTQIRAQTNT